MTLTKTNRFLCALLALCMSFISASAQLATKTSKHNSTGESSDITAIKTEYQRINSLALKKEIFKYESPGCVEDGIASYFLDNKVILKITESGSIGDGSWVKEYYYKFGKVIFSYEVLIGGPAEGKAIRTEYRFYIKNDRPIRCMEDKKIVPTNRRATETVQTAYKLLKAHTTKDFVAALCN